MEGATSCASAAWSLRGEYSRVYPYTYSLNNGQDFAHAGFPTAFPLGPDVDLWSGRLEWRPDAAWAFGLEVSDARKGAILLGQAWQPGQPVPTRMPVSIVFSPLGDYAYFSLLFNNEISTSDVYNLLNLGAIRNVGSGPDGVVLTAVLYWIVKTMMGS